VEVELQAESEAGLFEAAVEAYAELAAAGGGGEPARRELALAGGDHALLLVDLLNELVFLAETEAFVPERLERLELSDDGLHATVAGRIGDPTHLVKAVTLNRLSLAEEGGAWHGRVVLDV